jgi:hypothetical protein
MERLSGKHEALRSNPIPQKKKERKISNTSIKSPHLKKLNSIFL